MATKKKISPEGPADRHAVKQEETVNRSQVGEREQTDDFEVKVEQAGIPDGDHLVEIVNVGLFERIETRYGISDFVVWNVAVIDGENHAGKQDSIWHNCRMSERSNLGKMFIQYLGREKFFSLVGTNAKPRMLVGSVWRANFKEGKGTFDHFVRHTKRPNKDDLPF